MEYCVGDVRDALCLETVLVAGEEKRVTNRALERSENKIGVAREFKICTAMIVLDRDGKIGSL